MKPLRLASLILVALSIWGQAGFASPLGLWQAKDGVKIRIEPCDQNLCGFIAQTNPPYLKDKNNVDPAKRNRPLVGVQVLISMQPSGASKWSGQVYNDDNGRTYSGNLIELGPSTIKIEGCWLMICGGEELVRVK
jgi:uncharacterized protein (DUF2147 family)